ncbi:MAG: phospholipase D-like domain-containing protein [Actinomycetota bacterium]|nr:phospholipase D-like domain-containing protein [Actinomycetota bacterium]
MNKRWPAGMAALLATWYASDSLRHRREQRRHGYRLRGEEINVGSDSFLYASESLTSSPSSFGNEADLHINGDEIFPAFLAAIRGAKRSVNVVTYIYWSGEIGQTLADALSAKAREGVAVNVLLDAVGSLKMSQELIGEMDEAGACVVRFRPPKPYAVSRLNNRTHRKLLIADGRVGLTGGVGIADEWTGNAEDPDHWRDTHVTVRGPIVRGLQGAFAENWLEATGDVLVGPDYLPALEPVPDGCAMQLVRSQAGVGDTNVEALYFLAISCARERLHLTAGYFVPRPAFVEVLADAAQRGVDVRILVPGPHADKPPVRDAGRGTYQELLEAGVRIWEYQRTMIHAKTLTIDGAWASIGSVNFDNRSFQLQDEATLCIRQETFVAQLDEQFDRDLRAAEEIELERWKGRPVAERAKERTLTLVRREL